MQGSRQALRLVRERGENRSDLLRLFSGPTMLIVILWISKRRSGYGRIKNPGVAVTVSISKHVRAGDVMIVLNEAHSRAERKLSSYESRVAQHWFTSTDRSLQRSSHTLAAVTSKAPHSPFPLAAHQNARCYG